MRWADLRPENTYNRCAHDKEGSTERFGDDADNGAAKGDLGVQLVDVGIQEVREGPHEEKARVDWVHCRRPLQIGHGK